MVFGVTLKKHPLRWRKLPLGIRRQIVEGRHRLEALRVAIEQEAKLGPMPPVEIIDIGWASSESAILGLSRPIKVGKLWVLGTVLPASTVVCTRSDDVLRGVLVHEFSHCFHKMTQIVQALDDGKSSLDDTAAADACYDPAWDEEQHVVPEEWFGEEDASRFILQHDSSMDEATESVSQEWMKAGLPTETPSTRYEESISLLPSWIDHIRGQISR